MEFSLYRGYFLGGFLYVNEFVCAWYYHHHNSVSLSALYTP